MSERLNESTGPERVGMEKLGRIGSECKMGGVKQLSGARLKCGMGVNGPSCTGLRQPMEGTWRKPAAFLGLMKEIMEGSCPQSWRWRKFRSSVARRLIAIREPVWKDYVHQLCTRDTT